MIWLSANWFVMGSLDSLGGKLHLAAKLVQKKKTIPIVNLLRAPLLKGQTGDAALSAMLSAIYARYGGLLSLTRHSFPEQRICIKNLQLPKSPEKKAKQIKN
jgi:hypothetical protein